MKFPIMIKLLLTFQKFESKVVIRLQSSASDATDLISDLIINFMNESKKFITYCC